MGRTGMTFSSSFTACCINRLQSACRGVPIQGHCFGRRFLTRGSTRLGRTGGTSKASKSPRFQERCPTGGQRERASVLCRPVVAWRSAA